MKLYLIRHGETVDNIAGNYAGVKDSQLTIHGVEQTRKLGSHLANNKVVFTHIFASPLIRASRTAEAIRDAQVDLHSAAVPDIVKVADLIEQDFGYYEGKPFHVRSSPAKAGRLSHAEAHKDDPGFVDVESKAAMIKRADRFLTEHLMPTMDEAIEPIVAIVSHGMLLSTLWRRILLRIPRHALSIAPEITAARGTLILEHLGGWGNTGYLELLFSKVVVVEEANKADIKEAASSTIPTILENTLSSAEASSRLPVHADQHSVAVVETRAEELSFTEQPPQEQEQATPVEPNIRATCEDTVIDTARTDFTGFTVSILAIDSKTHLVGVKRQRGGIGRLAHDETQKKLTSFFKKPRTT